MDDLIRIHIPKFRKWQRDSVERRWLALDENYFFDRKVREARRLCPDAPECFMALWREADKKGDIGISRDALKSYWMEILCIESNRFNPETRLQALSAAGLISVKYTSGGFQRGLENPEVYTSGGLQCGSNGVLNESQRGLEQAETHVAVISDITNKQTVAVVFTQNPEELLLHFEKFKAEYPPEHFDEEPSRIAWSTMALDAEVDTILAGLRAWRDSADWAEEDGAWIPKGSNFLERKRWRKKPRRSSAGAGKTAPKSHWQKLIDSPRIVCIYPPHEARNGMEYERIGKGQGVDALLKHKTSGEVIRAGDYKPETQ